MNPLRIYEYILLLSCWFLYMLQMYYLLVEYMSGSTVINIEISHNDYDTPPAITVCPAGLALDKVALINEELGSFYDKYLNKSDLPGKQTYDKMEEIFKKQIEHGNIKLIDVMNKFTYPYKDEANDTNIEVWIKGTMDNNNYLADLAMNKHGEFTFKGRPIESLIFDKELYLHKCFTFFSHLDDEWRNLRLYINEIKIWVHFTRYSSKIYPRNHFKIFMHSPNDLPMLDSGQEKVAKNGTFNIVQYNKIKVNRLSGDYDTKCTDYVRGRSLCIRDCFIRKLSKHCNGSSMVRSPFMLLKNEMDRFGNISMVDCSSNIQLRYATLIECQSWCDNDCHYTYYPFTIDELYKFRPDRINRAEFKITSNGMPDIHIRYMPSMDLLAFMCNIGGLLGMWLGHSILSMFLDVQNIFTKLIRKLYPQCINIKNIFHVHLCHSNEHEDTKRNSSLQLED